MTDSDYKKASSWCRTTGVIAAVLAVAACTVTSHSLIGNARAPIAPDDVRLYTEAVTVRHDDIASVQTSSRRSWAFTSGGKFEVVINRLKKEAALLGANGLVLEDLTDARGSVGAGVAPDITRDHAEVGVGLNFSGLLSSRKARATAVYVYPR